MRFLSLCRLSRGLIYLYIIDQFKSMPYYVTILFHLILLFKIKCEFISFRLVYIFILPDFFCLNLLTAPTQLYFLNLH